MIEKKKLKDLKTRKYVYLQYKN